MTTRLICHLKLTICFCVLSLCGSKTNASATFSTTQIAPKPLWNETHLDRLKKDLLMNYDEFARPENHESLTHVKVGISIMRVNTDEQKGTVTVFSWLRVVWTDSKLKWNKDDYGGISVIRIGDHEVWQPDIYLYNTASGAEQVARSASRYVVVYANGEVLWVPPSTFTASCTYNLRYWPFDTQHCNLKLGSWVYSDLELNLTLYTIDSSAEVETTISSSPWEVETTSEVVSRKYPCCVESYSHAQFNLTLTRKSAPYKAIIVCPVVVSTFLILLQFWLPPSAGERIILNGFTTTTLIILLLYFNHQIIGVASETPLIVLYYSSSLYMALFSSIITIAGFSLSRIKRLRPLPKTIKDCLSNSRKWFLLEPFVNEIHPKNQGENIEEMKDHQLSEFESKTGNKTKSADVIQNEWTVFMTAVDRLLFIIYFLVFTFLAISYF